MGKIIVEPTAMAVADESIILAERFNRGIHIHDIFSNKTRFIGSIDDSEIKTCLYSKAISDGNQVFFIPHHANSVAIYYIKEQKLISVPLPDMYVGKLAKFQCGAIWRENLLLFGYSHSSILVMNIHTFEFSHLYNVENELNKAIGEEGYKILDAALEKDRVYIVSTISDELIQIDSLDEGGSCRLIHIENNGTGFATILDIDDRLLLLPMEGRSLFIFDSVTGEVTKKAIIAESMKRPFWFGVAHDDSIWLFPNNYSKIVKTDVDISHIDELEWNGPSVLGDYVMWKSSIMIEAVDERKVFRYSFADNSSAYIEMFSMNAPSSVYLPLFSRESRENDLSYFISGLLIDD